MRCATDLLETLKRQILADTKRKRGVGEGRRENLTLEQRSGICVRGSGGIR